MRTTTLDPQSQTSKSFLENQSGAIAIIAAVSMFVLAGGVGLAIDFGSWHRTRSQMQSLADGAALAGTVHLAKHINSANVQSVVDAYIAGRTDLTPAAKEATTTVAVDTNSTSVTVQMTTLGQQFLSQVVGVAAPTISVTAVASAKGSLASPACIIALDPSSAVGIDYGLSGSMTAHGCSIWSNSRSATSINANGSGSVTAATTCAVGGIAKTGILFTPEAVERCQPVEDPLAAWMPPSYASGCDFQDIYLDNNGDQTLAPGVYCGGVTANGTVTLNLQPGLYVMKDGPLSLTGGASIKGTNVSVLLTCLAPSVWATDLRFL